MPRVSNAAVGPPTGGGGSFFAPTSRLVGPGQNCLGGGRVLGATLDGQAVTQATTLPLGRHTVTHVWDDCLNGDPDEPERQSGGIMIEYDFPTVFGEGTYTLYFSGHGVQPMFGVNYETLNGILHVSNTRTADASGHRQDDILITLEPFFGAGPLREAPPVAPSTIALERHYDASETFVTDATFGFDVSWNDFDEDGWLGTSYGSSGAGNVLLHFNPDAGDGEPSHTSTDHVTVRMLGQSGDFYLGRILATGDVSGWRFTIDEPEGPDLPGDDD
jgi:hypothetical protein